MELEECSCAGREHPRGWAESRGGLKRDCDGGDGGLGLRWYVILRMHAFQTLLGSIPAGDARSALLPSRLLSALARGTSGSPPRLPGGTFV